MKSQRAKLLLILAIIATSSSITLAVLSEKKLPTITTQQPKGSTNINAQNWQKIQLSQQIIEPKKVVSVKDFGAIGDSIQDDTKAIQMAINAVYDAGGGIVNIPAGTYKVTINPNTSHAITIRPKVILQGASSKKSIIKLADRQGNYNSMFAGERQDSDLSNFGMYDLVIDGNGSNNPVKSKSDLSEDTMRYTLRIFVGSKINIERCKFTNQNNADVITVNGEVSDVVINNNFFESIGGGKIDYDHSTIYTHGQVPGKRIEIVNNFFSSRNGAGTNGARTAIEIHGDEHIVKDNVITGFTNGINVTGYSKSGSSNNLIVTGNVIKEAYTGIVIWSYFSPGNTTNPAISNSTIANNKISLNIDGWRSLWSDTPSAGISLEPNSDAPIKNLNILNNKISFKKLSARGHRRDNLASGIRLWRDAVPNSESENIRISGNKITNPLASGIYISMPIKGSEISQNNILNPGKSNGNFHDDYRAAIIVDGDFQNVALNNNLFVDNQAVNTIKGGIISSAICVNKCEASGNTLQVKSGANLEIFRSTSHTNNNGFKISQ